MNNKLRELITRAQGWKESDLRKFPTATLELIDSLAAALAASEPSAFDALKATPSAYEPISQKRLQRLEDEGASSSQPVTSAEVYEATMEGIAEPATDLRAKIEALRELSEKATAGIWRADRDNARLNTPVVCGQYIPNIEIAGNGSASWIAQVMAYPDNVQQQANADFIVACVNTIRAILEGKA